MSCKGYKTAARTARGAAGCARARGRHTTATQGVCAGAGGYRRVVCCPGLSMIQLYTGTGCTHHQCTRRRGEGPCLNHVELGRHPCLRFSSGTGLESAHIFDGPAAGEVCSRGTPVATTTFPLTCDTSSEEGALFSCDALNLHERGGWLQRRVIYQPVVAPAAVKPHHAEEKRHRIG